MYWNEGIFYLNYLFLVMWWIWPHALGNNLYVGYSMLNWIVNILRYINRDMELVKEKDDYEL